MNKKKKIIILLFFAAVLVVLVTSAFYNGLIIRKYTVKSDKLVENQGAMIVLIFDLYSHVYGENQSHVIGLIKKQAPDIIALAGDIADDIADIQGAELFLRAIQNIAPIYYVTGNHEVRSGKADEI